MHSTNNLDDGYLGSGTRLRRSIRKYGIEKHKKEILCFFDTREMLVEGEIELVTSEIINDEDCMNLKEGGSGGFTIEQQKKNNLKSQVAQRKLRKNNPVWLEQRNKKASIGILKAYDEGRMDRSVNYDWNGKKHSEKTKSKMRKSKNLGKDNSQSGTSWITNGVKNKKIKKGEQVPENWRLGRIMGL